MRMNFSSVLKLMKQRYDADGEYLWDGYPNFAVFRHAGGKRKWFALLMRGLVNEKLGRALPGSSDVINLKVSPDLSAILRDGKGIFAAYHMNKANWLTVSLDGSVPTERIKMLLDMSYRLTK